MAAVDAFDGSAFVVFAPPGLAVAGRRGEEAAVTVEGHAYDASVGAEASLVAQVALGALDGVRRGGTAVLQASPLRLESLVRHGFVLIQGVGGVGGPGQVAAAS